MTDGIYVAQDERRVRLASEVRTTVGHGPQTVGDLMESRYDITIQESVFRRLALPANSTPEAVHIDAVAPVRCLVAQGEALCRYTVNGVALDAQSLVLHDAYVDSLTVANLGRVVDRGFFTARADDGMTVTHSGRVWAHGQAQGMPFPSGTVNLQGVRFTVDVLGRTGLVEFTRNIAQDTPDSPDTPIGPAARGAAIAQAIQDQIAAGPIGAGHVHVSFALDDADPLMGRLTLQTARRGRYPLLIKRYLNDQASLLLIGLDTPTYKVGGDPLDGMQLVVDPGQSSTQTHLIDSHTAHTLTLATPLAPVPPVGRPYQIRTIEKQVVSLMVAA